LKIKWLQHPSKPELNGTFQHVARELAVVAAGYGQAEICPRPNYGTPEFAEERRQADALRGNTLHTGDTVVPNIEGTRWSIQNHALAGVVILRESGSEQTRFKDPVLASHYGAPKELCKELVRLIKEQVKKNVEAERVEAGNDWGKSQVKFI